MDLDAVADELYALEPGEFTAARTEREKQARADGDKELARQIHQLRKPTVTAWLANLLARERPDSLQPLRDLGAQLHEAQQTLQGDALRQLARQRHQLVYALVQEARELAVARGQKVGEQVARELEQTLDATLADPAAADTLLAGRLTTALQHTGFGPPAADAPSQAPPAGTAAKGSAAKGSAAKGHTARGAAKLDKLTDTQDRTARRRQAAQRDAEQAEQALRAAEQTLRSAEDTADELDRRQQDLTERIAELQRSLTEAEEQLAGVRRDARRAQRDRDRAAQASDRAERILVKARAALDHID